MDKTVKPRGLSPRYFTDAVDKYTKYRGKLARNEAAISNFYRDTARVPRGLTPRVNRVSFIPSSTILTGTVATWIKDLNPKQLRAVARNATPLKTRVLDVVRRVLSGRGGATGPHGHNGCSGVNSNRPISGRSRGIKFACVHPSVSGQHGQNGEASGLVPEVLH